MCYIVGGHRTSGDFSVAGHKSDLGLADRVLVADGAMGTMLYAEGSPYERPPSEASLLRPELVLAIHRRYIEAGANVIETNTFGASRYRLARYGLEDRTLDINEAAARLAIDARAAARREVAIAAAIGPATPRASVGRIGGAERREALAEQVRALAPHVDLVILETFGDLDEMIEAVETARSMSDLPIVAQMTFMDETRTLAGQSPADVARELERLAVTAAGANCTLGPSGLLEVIRALARHTTLPLAAQPNAGVPALGRGRVRYASHEDYFARYARRFVEAGAAIVGSCCGTTPEHTRAIAGAVAELPPGPRRPRPPATAAGVPRPSLRELLASGTFVVACELRPGPGDAEATLRSAEALRAAGATTIILGPAPNGIADAGSVALAHLIQTRLGMPVVLTVTTWGRSGAALQADLLGAHALGLRTILCRTGAPDPFGDYPQPPAYGELDASALLSLVGALNAARDRNGVAMGAPTTFFAGAIVNPTSDDRPTELRVLAERAQNADFLVTAPLWDLSALERLRGSDAPERPLLVGIQPLRDQDHAELLHHEVPGRYIPPSVFERLRGAGDREDEVALEIAREHIIASMAVANGVVIMTADRPLTDAVRLLRSLPR